MQSSATFNISLPTLDELGDWKTIDVLLRRAQTLVAGHVAAHLIAENLEVGEIWTFALVAMCCDVVFEEEQLAFAIVWLAEFDCWQIVVGAAHSNMSLFSDLALAHAEKASAIEGLSRGVGEILATDATVTGVRWWDDKGPIGLPRRRCRAGRCARQRDGWDDPNLNRIST